MTPRLSRSPLFLYVLSIVAFWANPGHAAGGSGARSSVFDAMRAELEPSTASLRQTSFNFPGSYLRNDTAAYSIEASIAPAFTVFQAHPEGLLGGSWLMDVVPKFVVRRSDGLASNPVRCPTYLPQATLFYSPTDSIPSQALSPSGRPALWYFSVTLSHYSNGQAGPFLQSDGSLNNVDGSFSLWSVSGGIHLIQNWPWLPAYKSMEVTYFYNKEGLLDALYPDFKVAVALHTREHVHGGWGGLGGRTQTLADFTWMVRKAGGGPASALKPDPFAVKLTGIYTPQWEGRSVTPGFSLFARYYAGYDDYNMNFDKEIYRLDAGLLFAIR